MRPPGPKFWLLEGRTGWRTAEVDGIDVSEDPGLRLADDPGGPLGLAAPGGSLGALRLRASAPRSDTGVWGPTR